MADLVKKTQFEKICPFPLMNAIMQRVKELQQEYKHSTWGTIKQQIDQVIYDMENIDNTIQEYHAYGVELAALSIVMTQKTGIGKPDS